MSGIGSAETVEDGRGTCSGLLISAVFCRFGPPSGVGLSSSENGKKGTAMLCSGPVSCCTGWGW